MICKCVGHAKSTTIYLTVHPTLSCLLLSPSFSRAFFWVRAVFRGERGKDSIHMVTFPRGRERWFSTNSKESLLCSQKRTKPCRKRGKRKSGLLNNSPRNFRGGIEEGQHALGGVLMNEESISGKVFFPLILCGRAAEAELVVFSSPPAIVCGWRM